MKTAVKYRPACFEEFVKAASELPIMDKLILLRGTVDTVTFAQMRADVNKSLYAENLGLYFETRAYAFSWQSADIRILAADELYNDGEMSGYEPDDQLRAEKMAAYNQTERLQLIAKAEADYGKVMYFLRQMLEQHGVKTLTGFDTVKAPSVNIGYVEGDVTVNGEITTYKGGY